MFQLGCRDLLDLLRKLSSEKVHPSEWIEPGRGNERAEKDSFSVDLIASKIGPRFSLL